MTERTHSESAAPGERPEYRASAKERRDVVKNARQALEDLKKELEKPSGKLDAALAALGNTLAAMHNAHIDASSEAWKRVQSGLAAELDAGTNIAALQKALDNPAENGQALALETNDLADELGLLQEYEKVMPKPGIHEKVWDHFAEKFTDPGTRAMVVQFLASFIEGMSLFGPIAAPIVGVVRYRAEREQLLADEHIDPAIREKLEKEAPLWESAYLSRYNAWFQNMARARNEKRPFTDPVPTVADLFTQKPAEAAPASSSETAPPQAKLLGIDGLASDGKAVDLTKDVAVGTVRLKEIMLGSNALTIGGKPFQLKNGNDIVQSLQVRARSENLPDLQLMPKGADLGPTLDEIVAALAEPPKQDGAYGIHDSDLLLVPKPSA